MPDVRPVCRIGAVGAAVGARPSCTRWARRGKKRGVPDTNPTMNRTRKPTGEQDVARWRQEQLLDAGFTAALATRLALDARRDVHALIELVDRGCPPELAERILAPLEEDA